MAFREAPPHHVSHAEGFDSQQVEDHGVSQPELGLEDGRLTLSRTHRKKSQHTNRMQDFFSKTT